MNKRAIFRIICFLVASIAITFLTITIAIHWISECLKPRPLDYIISTQLAAQMIAVLYLGLVWIVHIPYYGYFAYKGTFPIYGSCVWVFLTLGITFSVYGSIKDPLTTLLTIFATMQSVSFAAISLLVSRLWQKDMHGKVYCPIDKKQMLHGMYMRAIFRIICFLMASIAITFLAVAIPIYWLPEYRGTAIYNAILDGRANNLRVVAFYLGLVWIVHIPYYGYFAYKGTFPRYGSCAWVFLTLGITFSLYGSTKDPLTTLLTIFATMQSVLFAVISLLVSRLWRKDVPKKA